jgi:hypothetical protein
MTGKVIPLALLAATLMATGCRVQENKVNGHEDVKVETPLGGIKVKTNESAIASDIGLAVYPGATVVQKDKGKGKDSDAADVDMSFGDFHLRVKAVSFRTSDSPEKVSAFYRKELARYGDVIECRDNHPVGTPSKTREGLTCDDNDKHVRVSDVDINGELELKAGGKSHQHIVAVEPESGGTKFGLVVLDLPMGRKESN